MTILFILITILLFGALIAIHEFGHFIAAKTLGVRVEEFAIVWALSCSPGQGGRRPTLSGPCPSEGSAPGG